MRFFTDNGPLFLNSLLWGFAIRGSIAFLCDITEFVQAIMGF